MVSLNQLRSISLKKNTLQILLILILLVAAGLMNWLTDGKSNQLNQLTQNYNNLQLQLETVQGQLAKLSNVVKNSRANNTSVSESLANQLPLSMSISDALVQITKLAASDGIDLQSFTYSNSPSSPPSTMTSTTGNTGNPTLTLSSLPSAAVNISVAGSVAKVRKFILDLEHQTQLTAVQSFSLNYGLAGATTVSISLAMYYQ